MVAKSCHSLFCSSTLLILLFAPVRGASPMDECNRAFALMDSGRIGEAIPIIQDVIDKNPGFPYGWELLGRAFGQMRPLDAGESYFRARSHHPLSELGLLWMYRGQGAGFWDQAVRHAAECMRGTGEPSCYLALGLIGIDVALVESAVRHLPLEPESPVTLFVRAHLLLKQGKNGEARGAALRALAESGTTVDPEFQFEVETLIYVAEGPDLRHRSRFVELDQRRLEAARQQHHWDREMTALAGLAGEYLNLGESEKWREPANELLRLARERGCGQFEASTLELFGRVARESGDLAPAIDYYQQAAKKCKESRCATTAIKLLSLASLLQQAGDLHLALQTAEQSREAIRDYAPSGEPGVVQEAFRQRTLGNIHEELGDWYQSLRHSEESVRLFRSVDNNWTAGAGMGNSAGAYAALGDLESAMWAAHECYESGRQFNDRSEQERCLGAIAQIELQRSRPRAAIRVLEKALAAAPAVGNKRFEATGWLLLAAAHKQLGNYGTALTAATRALERLREIGSVNEQAGAYAEHADIQLRLGNLDGAEIQFGKSLALSAPAMLADTIVAARRGLAEVARRRGRLDVARSQLDQAIAITESLRSRIPDVEMRTGYLAENWKVFEEQLRVLAELHRHDPLQGFDRLALSVAEKSRARAFVEMLVESKTDLSARLTEDERQRSAHLETVLSRAYTGASRGAIERAEHDLSAWAMELRERHPEMRQAQYPEPWPADRIQALIRERGIVMVEFAVGDELSLAWVVDRGGVQMRRLPGRARIDAEVRALRALLERRPGGVQSNAQYDQRAAQVMRMLFGPLEVRVRTARQIVIVPDGALHYVPFEALRTTVGKYLVEGSAVSYVPSASALGEMLAGFQSQPAPRPMDLLAYGDPAFRGASGAPGATGPAERVRAAYERSGLRMEPLPGSRDEVLAIGALYRPDRRKLVLGNKATESSVKSEPLARYRRIHFASHAVLDERQPSRSGVVLAATPLASDEDGILRMNEIMTLKLDADLVTLSACQTGLGKLIRGEGMVGLTRAFLYAGARRVVVSLWQVNDIATAQLMKRFYSEMNHGAAPQDALRTARLAMLHADQVAWRHPYYWAPFVVVGAR
jgi:CHAT domain-containing protein